ncbi:MAG: PAS domain-containing protein [Candidatus Cloacimonetes bacterium]|nr:PAS domain-containing protein [Candidatus Cloacimonadota bacterium]
MKVNVNNTNSNFKLSPEILSSTFSLFLLTTLLVIIHICFGHLFFHAIAELFSVFVGVLMLVVIANTSTFIKNSFLLYLSISYFWLAILDVFHTFTFPGMILSDNTHGQLTLQFWVYARFIESLVLLICPVFLKKHINGKLYFSISCIVCCIIVWGSLNLKNPQMITEEGLTPFKIYSEYLIMFILLLALLNFLRLRTSFNPSVFWYIFSSLCLTIASEYFLTLYEDVYHVSVIIGHVLKFLSFSLIYQAVVRTTLRSPFESLAQVSNSHDAIPHPSIIVSKECKISQVNNSALQLIKISHDNINNDHIHQHFHPNTFIESQCSFCQSIITGTTLSQETVYFPQYDKWYLLSLTPLKLLDKVEGMVQTLTDISELIASNDKLEKETKEKTSAITKTQNLQKYLASIFDSIPSMLVAVDTKCLITQWNLKAQETINREFKSVQHQPLEKVFPFLKEDIDTILTCIDKKQTKIINNRQWTKSTDIKYFDIIIFPLVVDTMVESLIIIDDVSTQFKLKEQFDMAKKMETIGQLSGGIAHDFNNMLGAILGAAELLSLKNDKTDSDRSIYLEIIINTVQKATGLTSKLLSFSRKKQLHKTVIDFHEVIDDTLLITQ